MNTDQLELPAAYELIHYGEIDNLRTGCTSLAQEGAEEGTLIWADSQTNATGRLQQTWHCGQGDLHCGIILRPDFPIQQYSELLLVATVSMAHALATHLSAMTALSLTWPNNISIAKHKVASVWIDASTETDNPWLCITSSVNIENSPEDFSILGMSVKEAEGETGLTSAVLLESYARQFITQINNWSERGMSSMVGQWKIRAEGMGEEKIIRLKNETYTGVFEEVLDNGDIVLRLPNNNTRIVNLADFIELTTNQSDEV